MPTEPGWKIVSVTDIPEIAKRPSTKERLAFFRAIPRGKASVIEDTDVATYNRYLSTLHDYVAKGWLRNEYKVVRRKQDNGKYSVYIIRNPEPAKKGGSE
jgi:hypothetical protein